MKRKMTSIAVLMLALGLGSNTFAGSLEGLWKLESGVWPTESGAMVFPGEVPSSDGENFRVFTKSHHFFMVDAPAMELFKAIMTSYSVDGDKLTFGPAIAGTHKSDSSTVWSMHLEDNRLTLEMEGNKEVWVRAE